MSEDSHNKLQLWGGVECTVNRVREDYFEQLRRSGHESRISDLERFAELGITALRQPVLWERVAPNGPESADWSWCDAWLGKLWALKVRPIVGLVHHGSGPRSTNLLDPEFPNKLAKYAGAVARRYEWVTDYTPVNEPLTTARFSALYGHWYPHARDDRSFVRALLNQSKAVALSMRAIREVNPDARLVQTEDLGKVFSTPRLRDQADFENERRWLTFDLLCGRVGREHPLAGYLLSCGAPVEELRWFEDHPTPPDILGFNYYLSSERFLDDQIQRYPEHLHGGNGRDRYVDVEAARVRLQGLSGAGALLREAWRRFELPLAITECHNGCTREEQLRWMAEVWEDCEALKSDGVDVRAVTAWSLLGAFDWNSLVTRGANHYEPGVFDVRSPVPRKTAIGKVLRTLADGEELDHPLLDSPGWWHRPERLVHEGAITGTGRRIKPHGLFAVITKRAPAKSVRPVVITGGTGTLGRAFERACIIRGIAHRLTLRSQLDVANPDSVARYLDVCNPWAFINTAGYVRVDDAETDVENCMRENVRGPEVLARECARRGIRFVTFSSDLVFDGAKTTAYVESDKPNPLNVYGESKRLAEDAVLREMPGGLVIRTSAFFGPWDRHNFVTVALRELAAGRKFVAAEDAVVSPTYVPDLVGNTLDLMIDGEQGIWHLANPGELSWYELALCAARMASLRTDLIVPCKTEEMGLAARRPKFSALASEKAWIMPQLEDALARYIRERESHPTIEAEAA